MIKDIPLPPKHPENLLQIAEKFGGTKKLRLVVHFRVVPSWLEPGSKLNRYQEVQSILGIGKMGAGVNLYDCFSNFGKIEKLDMWYCSNCKEHV